MVDFQLNIFNEILIQMQQIFELISVLTVITLIKDQSRLLGEEDLLLTIGMALYIVNLQD